MLSPIQQSLLLSKRANCSKKYVVDNVAILTDRLKQKAGRGEISLGVPRGSDELNHVSILDTLKHLRYEVVRCRGYPKPSINSRCSAS
ncbi:hypothetical protein VNO77_03147 [Canavalia gladiata]|uniref:Uncharacterized protein n=1 Tax=Canavalia gladiata TaxID=3824 RepID=A0AAN9MU85_CANGL